MKAFKAVCREAAYRVRENPPGMELIWEDRVVEDLFKEARVALEAGADVGAVYSAVDAARPEVEPFPAKVERMLLARGLHPNTKLSSGRCLLLDKLKRVYPPPVRAGEGWGEEGEEDVPLVELLEMGPDTSITDSAGNTALHVLVGSASDLYRDDDRADYLKDAFQVMVEAGFDADATDNKGRTVKQLLQDGCLRYTKSVRSTPCKGLRDMQRAIRDCLRLVGAAVPDPPAVAGAEGPVWPMGINKGTPIKELDRSFVRWLCKNFDFTPPAKQELLQQLVAAGKVREGPSGQLVAL